MKKIIIILGLIVFFVFVQDSFSLKLLTLEESIRIALERNFAIKIAENESKILNNNLSYGIGELLPRVDLSGRINNLNQNVKQEFIDGRKVDRDGAKSNSYEGGVMLNWTVFDGLKMFITYNKLGELKGLGELKLKSRIETIIKDVTIAYYSSAKQQIQLSVISENLEISRKRYEFVRNKFDIGTASKTEMLQASVDLNADISDSIDLNIAYENSKLTLNRLINSENDINYNISENFDIDNDFVSSEEIKKAQLNTDVIIAQKSLELSDFDIEAFKSEYYPKISLYSGWNYNLQESEAGFLQSSTSTGFNYGINFSLSILDGLSTSRQIENAKVNKMIADYMLQDLTEAVKSSILTTCNTYTKFKELSEFENQNLSSATENMELALESLNLGLISQVEFRESQKQLSNARLRLLISRYNAKISETELLRLTGSSLK